MYRFYPYIFGYYPCGFDMTYCYLYNEGNQVYQKDLVNCNFKTLLGCINAFVIRRNIGQLFTFICEGLGDSFHK